MAINLIIDPNATNTKGIENGIPEYNKFIPYVELYAVKYNEVEFVLNGNGTADIRNAGVDREVVNFLGFDTKTGTYSSRYTDDLVGEDVRFDFDEGFGITDIDIDIKSKFVPTIEIVFRDVRGSSLLNEQQKKTAGINQIGSPYAVLFDFPPPTFVLIMKAAYGKAVRFVLHMLKHDVTFDSSTGDWIIKAKFVGKTFAPLSDLKIGWILAAPYINTNIDFTGDVFKTVNTFFELKHAGTELYNKLNELNSSSKEVKTIQKINNDLSILAGLTSEITTFTFDTSIKVKNVNDNSELITGDIINTDTNNYPVTSKNQTNDISDRMFVKITIPNNTSDNSLYFTVLKTLKEHQQGLISPDYKRIVGLSNFSDKDILIDIRQGTTINNTSKSEEINFYFDYTDYLSKITQAKIKLVNDLNTQQKVLTTKVNSTVKGELGFEPNIKNVMNLLCNDIDIFFNKIKEAGEPRTGVANGVNAGVQVIDDAAWPRVTQKVTQNSNGISITREVAIYPGSDEVLLLYPQFAQWKEVQFVESFIKAYFKLKTFEEEINQLEKLNDDGTKKIIPINPFDTDVFGSSKTLSYLNKTSLDQILLAMTKRYFIATQYTYKGFWSGSFVEKRRIDLINYLARAEAQNIATSIIDEKFIDIMLTNIQNNTLFNSNAFLSNLEAFTISNKQLTSTSSLFLNDTSIVDQYKIDDTNIIYSFKDNINYKGIELYDGFDPKVEVVDQNSIEDKEKPTKYLIDFINGGFFNDLFKRDGEKPSITKENLIYFKDVRKDEKTYDSDFLDINSEFSDFITLNQLAIFGFTFGLSGVAQVKSALDAKNDDFIHYLTRFHNKENVDGLYNQNNKITTLEQLEDIILSPVLGFGVSRVDGKFLYPGVIELPKLFLIAMGKLLKNDINSINISQIDKSFFVGYYDNFVINSSNLINSFNNSIAVLDIKEDIIKNSDLITYIFESVYIVNFTSFTFLDQNDSDNLKNVNGIDLTKFYNLFKKQNGQYVDDIIKFDTTTTGTQNEAIRANVFIDILKSSLVSLLKQKKKDLDTKKKDFNNNLRDSDLKTQLYYSFKLIYDRWIKGTEGFSPNNGFAYPYSQGTALIDKFKFVDRAYNDIGEESIVDFSDLLDYCNNSDAEVYGGISAFLAKNSYDFFPLPNFIDFAGANKNNNVDPWQDAFAIEETAEITTQPVFTCMYVGGYSSQQDDSISFNNPTLTPADFKDNTFAFNVNYGTQNQSIFKDIQLSTTEYKETGESLRLMDNIFKNLETITPTPKGQNLFEVYENRSYSCSINVPFGNMLIQPTQYFELLNIPLFNGVYIILEVKHRMSASNNKIETTFSGSRIKRYISPIVTKPIASVLGVSSELTTLMEQTNNTNDPTINSLIKLNPSSPIIRKEDKFSTNIVRQLNTNTFTNDSRFLTFTQTEINTSNVGVDQVKQK